MILDVSRTPDADRIGFAAQERHQQDIFRLEDRVALELADPVALLGLPRQEPVAAFAPGPIPGRRAGESSRRDRATRARPIPKAWARRLRPCWRSCVPDPLPHSEVSEGWQDHEKRIDNRWNAFALPASGAHPTCVMQIRSRSNFAKILGRFGSNSRSPMPVKICLFCEHPTKPRRQIRDVGREWPTRPGLSVLGFAPRGNRARERPGV